ncbi:MAG: SHOCT domain-containing protein [Rubrobacteridae bacterium]|nr:SHOCT domain-containing protein [Rubrobacteridae bacterium]
MKNEGVTDMMHAWDSPYAMGSIGPLLPILTFLFWTLVIVGIVFAVKYFVASAKPAAVVTAQPIDSPSIEILRERYARGEIGTEEFEEKINVLKT